MQNKNLSSLYTFLKKLLCILIFIANPIFLFAQKDGNIWCFGDSAGVDFNAIPPIAFMGGTTSTHEASSSICNKNGDLLFYTGSDNLSVLNNITIWNKYKNIIQNGNGLYGYNSVTQGTLLLPAPQNEDTVYLFHVFPFEKLYYSVIDKDGDSGNGRLVVKNKVLLSDSLTEKMVAVRHANGRDWWLILHGNSNKFIEFLLQKDTIKGPFEQRIGSSYTADNIAGQLCISKNGDKLASVTYWDGIIDIFDFDRCTGVLSNWMALGNGKYNYYGCSISVDNSKLYVSEVNQNAVAYSYLLQYDLHASDIIASKLLICQLSEHYYHFGQHQLGPDNKIYIAKGSGNSFPNSIYDTNNMFLSIIENPDLSGSACQFVLNGLYLGGRRTESGLPNIPNYALGVMEGSECDTIPEPVPEDTTPRMYIPNIFSPNGDGINDVFMIRGTEIMTIHLAIYNRWGEVVFESQNQSLGWNGKRHNKDCPEGAYFYTAEVTFNNNDRIIKKGNITLVR